MKIAFDGYWLISGPPSQRHVVRETLLEWTRSFPADDLIVVVPRGDVAAARLLLPHTNVEIVGTPVWPQAAVASMAVPLVAARRHADAVLVQNFAARYRRSVVFIHDVLFCDHPEWFTRAERIYFAAMPRLARLADSVLTSTGTEANRIKKHTKHPSVQAVGLGTPRELTDAPAERPDACPTDDKRFYLTVGRLNIRKNLVKTIRSFARSGLLSPTSPLLIAGEANGKSVELPADVEGLVASGHVRFLGHVSDAELKWLYENAALFAFLSLGEGYGMPPVEACVLGCPTVVADLPVFHETLGDRVTYCDPHDTESAARSLAEAAAKGMRPDMEPVPWSEVVRNTRAAIEGISA